MIEFSSLCLATKPFPLSVLAIGGQSPYGDYCYEVERYNVLKDEWDTLPYLDAARVGAACCQLGKSIYIYGGKNDRHGHFQ